MEEHIPVLYTEVLDGLNIRPGGLYIDGTLGGGGHTRGILERGGRVLAFDRDPEAIQFARTRLGAFGEKSDQIEFVNANFAEMWHYAPKYGYAAGEVDGILLDLGLSSRQLDDPERGFSFRYEAPLDMRFDPQHQTETAADLVNNLSERALADIFWRYGDERRSRKFARAIVHNRPLTTTKELADLIADQVGRRGRIHPATKVFQALRIAVNDELDSLEEGLKAAINLLKPGGRVAVISFHSLEDRIVKNIFRDLSKTRYVPPDQPFYTREIPPVLKRITRKPITPGEEEVEHNPRSRSAKLRIAERLPRRA